MGEMRNTYKILVGKHGNRQLGRPRRRWEGNIRTVIRETGWKGADLTQLPQYRDQ